MFFTLDNVSIILTPGSQGSKAWCTIMNYNNDVKQKIENEKSYVQHRLWKTFHRIL